MPSNTLGAPLHEVLASLDLINSKKMPQKCSAMTSD